jgi:hypothetical protein
MHARLHRVLLGRQAERIPAHRMQHVEALHATSPADDVGGDVAEGMADVQSRTRWVREHVEAIELRSTGVEARIAGVQRSIRALFIPRALPPLLEVVGQRGAVAEGNLVALLIHGREQRTRAIARPATRGVHRPGPGARGLVRQAWRR